MCIELMGYGFVLLWSLRLRYGNDYSSLLKITLAYSLSLVAAPVLGLIVFNDVANEALIKNMCGSIASFLVGCYAFAKAYKAGRRLYDRTYWAFAFKFNAVLVPHNLSGVILTQSDRIMIATLISEAAAAIYSVAYTLGVAVQVITQALINAINPWMYRKLESDHGKGISKVIVPLAAVVGVLIVCAVLIMPEIFTAFFPADYSQALYVIPPVAAGVLWAFIFNLYASIELYFMKNNLVSIASIGGAILNIVLNLITIPIFGYMASAFATLICDIAYALFHTVFASKSLKHAGFGSKVLPIVPLWGTGIFVTVIVLAIMAIYPYRVIRYLIVVAAIIVAVIFRKNLIRLIKFKAE